MIRSEEVTSEECYKYTYEIENIFGKTLFSDPAILEVDKELVQAFFGPMKFSQKIFFNENKFIGVVHFFTEADEIPVIKHTPISLGITQSEFDETIKAIYTGSWWVRRMDSIIVNCPWLIESCFIEEALKSFPTPHIFEDSHPDIKIDSFYSMISGITDLQKGSDFLSSLNTKKRSYLKARRYKEEWEKYEFNFKIGASIPDEFWRINAQHWYDFWLPTKGEETANYDKSNILYMKELFKLILNRYPESVLVTEVKNKVNNVVVGFNLALILNWKHVSPQVVSINFFQSDYSVNFSTLTHAVHFHNIEYLYHKNWKWYCLGTLGECEDGYGVYKTHFRNGDFKTISNCCISDHWISEDICPPLYAHGRLITDINEFEEKYFLDFDSNTKVKYKRILK